ncbi:MAG: FCD domain-containing protein [Pikeienuella sp.]
MESNAAEQVIADLERRIFSNQFAGGEMLPSERELIESYAVSRTVIREAVKTLGAKGLVDIRPRHRPIVKVPDYEMAAGMLGGVVQHLMVQPGGVRQIFDMRIFIEAGLARGAAANANRDDIRRLKEALYRNGESVQDSQKFYETDMSFHAALYAIPGNPILPAVHRAFCDWLEGHWSQMPRLPDRNQRNFEAHSAIFEAITMRDPDLAEQRLRQHLDDAWRQVENTFPQI